MTDYSSCTAIESNGKNCGYFGIGLGDAKTHTVK
jgi:hypothetical protein